MHHRAVGPARVATQDARRARRADRAGRAARAACAARAAAGAAVAADALRDGRPRARPRRVEHLHLVAAGWRRAASDVAGAGVAAAAAADDAAAAAVAAARAAQPGEERRGGARRLGAERGAVHAVPVGPAEEAAVAAEGVLARRRRGASQANKESSSGEREGVVSSWECSAFGHVLCCAFFCCALRNGDLSIVVYVVKLRTCCFATTISDFARLGELGLDAPPVPPPGGPGATPWRVLGGGIGRECVGLANRWLLRGRDESKKSADRENCSAGTPTLANDTGARKAPQRRPNQYTIMAEDGSAAKKPKIKCSARQNIPKYGFKPAATMIAGISAESKNHDRSWNISREQKP